MFTLTQKIQENKTKGVLDVENVERILCMLDHSLNTKKKRHIAGGILMSVSLFFGGLAFTVLTIRTDNTKEELNEQELIS